jgi:hypothetical protein
VAVSEETINNETHISVRVCGLSMMSTAGTMVQWLWKLTVVHSKAACQISIVHTATHVRLDCSCEEQMPFEGHNDRHIQVFLGKATRCCCKAGKKQSCDVGNRSAACNEQL